jgi:hypothetical protein
VGNNGLAWHDRLHGGFEHYTRALVLG